ncbi:MAG: mismatch-specific DNA-glycosylase [Candidatus Xenobia bacterium]
METLPDLLRPGLRLVFVGINPSSYSVAQGHYFARKQNRFWPAFSLSRLSAPVRQALQVEALRPEHDVRLPEFGIGFTDVVKDHSPNASTLTAEMFERSVPRLVEKLLAVAPQMVCFHGLMGFRPFVRWGLQQPDQDLKLGVQPFALYGMRLCVIPNPSPANAHFTLADQVGWYDYVGEKLTDC